MYSLTPLKSVTPLKSALKIRMVEPGLRTSWTNARRGKTRPEAAFHPRQLHDPG